MTRLGFITRCLALSGIACLFGQLWIDRSYANMVSVSLVLASLGLLVGYFAHSKPFEDTPVSALAVFGFFLTSMYVALVAQTLSGNALIHLLRAPELTFSLLTITFAVAVGCHWVYRRFLPFSALRDAVARTLLTPLGIHDVPAPFVLWLMGAIGLASMAAGGASAGDVGGKAFQAMEFLAWAPFLILVFHRRFGEGYGVLIRHLPLIGVYALVIVAIAVGRNARQLMFIGPVIAVLIYFIVAVRDPGVMPRKSVVKVLMALGAGVMAVVMVADLATAMVIVRNKREGAGTREMLEETFYAMLDRQKLADYREQSLLTNMLGRYDEAYLSNPVLNRLSETKFHDNMLFFGDRMDAGQRDDVFAALGDKILVIAPQPLLDFFKLGIKKYDNYYSMGDVYVSTAVGGGLGGYTTGSVWADLYVMTGLFYPFAVALAVLPIFMALDSLTRLDEGYFISPLAFCMAWTIFLYGLGGESVAVKVAFLLRDLPQKILLYAAVLALMKFAFRSAVHRPAQAQPAAA